jgi:hypothetical protein
MEYRKYKEALDANGILRLFDKKYSRKLKSIRDLEIFFSTL